MPKDGLVQDDKGIKSKEWVSPLFDKCKLVDKGMLSDGGKLLKGRGQTDRDGEQDKGRVLIKGMSSSLPLETVLSVIIRNLE